MEAEERKKKTNASVISRAVALIRDSTRTVKLKTENRTARTSPIAAADGKCSIPNSIHRRVSMIQVKVLNGDDE